ncbi:hypothetical protein CDAR_218391, partial [Caerostris darwini]
AALPNEVRFVVLPRPAPRRCGVWLYFAAATGWEACEEFWRRNGFKDGQ